MLKEFCQKSCAQDFSECCKYKVTRRKEKQEKKKESENSKSKNAANLLKLPPTIQVNYSNLISQQDIIIMCEDVIECCVFVVIRFFNHNFILNIK